MQSSDLYPLSPRGAQIGGMLFVMELSTRWRPELTWRTFFATAATAYCIVACVGRCSTSADRARCSFYTSGGLLSVQGLSFETHVSDGLPVALLGVLGGLFGAIFNRFHCEVRQRPNFREWPILHSLRSICVVLFKQSMTRDFERAVAHVRLLEKSIAQDGL
jgi:chloride channel 7